MAEAAADIIKAADNSWAELDPVLASAEEAGLISREAFTRDRLRWGFSMLLSRLARLPGKDDEECCIPWADMLNHAADASCHLDWNPGEPTVPFSMVRGSRVVAWQ